MGFPCRLPLALLVCLTLGTLSPAATSAVSANKNSLHARSTASKKPEGQRAATTFGIPPGGQQLQLDDGTSEFSVGVTDQTGQIGSQAVYLNRVVLTDQELPITIDSLSFLFPTSDQFGPTGLFPQQTFQALVYLSEESSSNPADIVLANRTTFDLEPSNTEFQTVVLSEPVTVRRGTVLFGFTDPYVAVTHDPIFPAAVDADTLSNDSFVFNNNTPGDDFDGENLAEAENSGYVYPDGTFLIRANYSTAGAVSICWDSPTADGAAPTNNRICSANGAKCGECEARGAAVTRDGVTGFNVYRGTSPNVQPTPGNLFASVPPGQTTVDSSVAPGGSFFVVTAVYDDGESAPSNEASARPAAIASIKAGKKITAKGTNFLGPVQVFVDGIPFVQPAKLKGTTKVTQKGNLITGQTLSAYLASHGGPARVSFRNADGTMTTVPSR